MARQAYWPLHLHVTNLFFLTLIPLIFLPLFILKSHHSIPSPDFGSSPKKPASCLGKPQMLAPLICPIPLGSNFSQIERSCYVDSSWWVSWLDTRADTLPGQLWVYTQTGCIPTFESLIWSTLPLPTFVLLSMSGFAETRPLTCWLVMRRALNSCTALNSSFASVQTHFYHIT